MIALRKWLFQIQVEFPDSVVEEDLGTVLLGDIRFRICRNRLPRREKTDYVLYGIKESDDPFQDLYIIGEKAEPILDKLSFQLQAPVPMSYVEALDMSDPVKEGDIRELKAANSPRIQKDTECDFPEKWDTQLSLDLLRKEIDETTEAALRWFSKGLSTRIAVDRFTSFWIALEILTSPLKPKMKEAFFKCNDCGYRINSCPSCGSSTEYFPDAKMRIRNHIVTDLKLDKTVFERLWNVRQLFHGRNWLREEDIVSVFNATVVMKRIIVQSLKRKLGLAQEDKPIQLASLPIPPGSLFIGGTRQVMKTDIARMRTL